MASPIYGSIVSAARQKTFYETWGVADTREGRLEMIILHVALVMRRLSRISEGGADLGRAVGEAFIVDMDDNMREIGIGDLAVPRKIKRAAAALFDRHRDYGAAIDAGDRGRLAEAIRAAVPAGAAHDGVDAGAIASYALDFEAYLSKLANTDCLAGQIDVHRAR
jgi:cytochrome b pre-mRNA-processing protein 3